MLARTKVLSGVRTYLTTVGATPTTRASKVGGDISSLFPSLSGMKPPPLPDRFAQLKRRYVEGREQALTRSWEGLLLDLDREIEVVKKIGSDIIPQVEFKDLGNLSSKKLDEIKKRGSVVIKGVIPEKEAVEMKQSLKEYIKVNPLAKAFPASSPAIWELYWAPAQRHARRHPSLLASQRFVNSLWNTTLPPSEVDISIALPYADRFRIRQPGDAGFALGPHIDGGSVERWEDPEYAKCYEKIWTGKWEEYDPFNVDHRVHADMDMYDGAGSCAVWRSWQGWLSLSNTGPNEGTLLVNPLLKHATSYTILRPFFTTASTSSFSSSSDYSTISTTSAFPGAVPSQAQEYSQETHPHLRLSESMTHIPLIAPGDYVFWHCDTIHAVDSVHRGNEESSVMYIPAVPWTKLGEAYVQRQAQAEKDGLSPEDFPIGVAPERSR